MSVVPHPYWQRMVFAAFRPKLFSVNSCDGTLYRTLSCLLAFTIRSSRIESVKNTACFKNCLVIYGESDTNDSGISLHNDRLRTMTHEATSEAPHNHTMERNMIVHAEWWYLLSDMFPLMHCHLTTHCTGRATLSVAEHRPQCQWLAHLVICVFCHRFERDQGRWFL